MTEAQSELTDEARSACGGQQLPLACSLSSGGMDTRRDEWSSLLAEALVDTMAMPDGVRLVLRPSPQTAEAIERLIGLERECCPWIDWVIQEDQFLLVDATAEHEDGAALLREWFPGPSPNG